MKFSNFKFIKLVGKKYSDYEFFATVDVTESPNWWEFWKQPITTTRSIRREYADFWHFVDTGKFTPGIEVEELFRSYESQHGKVIK